jgi:lipoyl(octanoyl) transferase
VSAAIGRSVCIEVVSLGQMDYPEAIARMDTRVAARKREEAGDALLLVEHPPVITVGKRGDIGNLVATEEVLARKGVTLHHTSRGGDITFHGPGQLVGYPVLDIRSRGLGARDYVDRVEETLIRTLSRLGVESAERMTGRTGVWVEGAKVAAIGVHVSRGVTSHGFALNVCTDLSWFDLIVPCGIAAPVTSVTQLRDTPTTIEEVTPILVAEIGEIFDSRMVR